MPELLSNVTHKIWKDHRMLFVSLYFLKLQKMLWMPVDNHYLTILEEYY